MSESSNPQRREDERLLAIFSGPELLEFLAGQLSVLKHQAQMLLGLCGLAITVTGFSGTQMIQAGRLSAIFLVVGIGLILLGALGSLHSLMQVRWVTEEVADDLVDTAYAVIQRRNAQLRRLSIAGILVAQSHLKGTLSRVSSWAGSRETCYASWHSSRGGVTFFCCGPRCQGVTLL